MRVSRQPPGSDGCGPWRRHARRVTDAGLVHLKPLPKLTKRKVSRTAVTDQGVKDAKKFLPFFATVTR